MNERIDKLQGKLIVSCQALPDEPLHSSFIMGRMAYAAAEGGSKEALRKEKDDSKARREEDRSCVQEDYVCEKDDGKKTGG